MNDEKWVSDSDMEDIAGGAGKKGAKTPQKDDGSKPADPHKPGAGSGPYKGNDKKGPDFS